jgi:filamentous hemagglutinin
MNQNLYRIVFNKNTGAQAAGAGATSRRHRNFSSGLTVAMLFGGIHIAYAQIQADPNAAGNQRPVIDNTANGLPLVQIATPNAAGLSHNQYRQFNVDQSGAILNNASHNANTQLGGWVGGNPNLSNGGARIILNEVTSTHPSALRGYLEVAGRRADVVVSNPNGILVDGAGFINTSRGVITTGIPTLGGNGSMDGFRATQGAIRIGAGGFNDRDTDQVDLIARSVQVNGQLYAKRLNVVAGANQVDYADLGVQLIQGAGNVPSVAIDVAALGGMFANSIRLIGTEAGVGVVSYGKMAATAGDFGIDSAGRITLAADTSASGKLHLASGDSIVNQARISSGDNMDLRAADAIDNHGRQLLSGGDLSMNSASFDNGGGAVQSNRQRQAHWPVGWQAQQVRRLPHSACRSLQSRSARWICRMRLNKDWRR